MSWSGRGRREELQVAGRISWGRFTCYVDSGNRFMGACVSHSVVSDLFATPWTAVRQAPLSTGFPRPEYWSELPCPSPRDLPDSGIEPRSPAL